MRGPPDNTRRGATRIFRHFDPAPSDMQLLRSWDGGLSSNDIARAFNYPEFNVESRLWRLREERREREARA